MPMKVILTTWVTSEASPMNRSGARVLLAHGHPQRGSSFQPPHPCTPTLQPSGGGALTPPARPGLTADCTEGPSAPRGGTCRVPGAGRLLSGRAMCLRRTGGEGPVTAGPRPRAQGTRTGGEPRLPQVQALRPSPGTSPAPVWYLAADTARPRPGGRVRARVWPGPPAQAREHRRGQRLRRVAARLPVPSLAGPAPSPLPTPHPKPEASARRSLHENKRTR